MILIGVWKGSKSSLYEMIINHKHIVIDLYILALLPLILLNGYGCVGLLETKDCCGYFVVCNFYTGCASKFSLHYFMSIILPFRNMLKTQFV